MQCNEINRIKMVECLIVQAVHINLEDDIEVILHTNAVDYFELAGRCFAHLLCCLNVILSLKAPKLGSDL